MPSKTDTSGPGDLSLDKDSRVPLYVQVGEQLRAALQRGEWQDAGGLPSERQLAEELRISRLTVRRALALLQAEGEVVRRQGARTLARHLIEQPLPALTGFTEDMRARGLQASSRWVSRTLAQPNSEEALALGVGPGTTVARLVRVRCADGEPIVVERATIAAGYLPDLDVIGDSLYATLESGGWVPIRAVQRMWAARLSDLDASLLGVEQGAPTLCSQRVTYLASGVALEFTVAQYRAEQYDFVVELHGKANKDS